MPVVTVRNLSEETHIALKLRAAQYGRSTEAEIRKNPGTGDASKGARQNRIRSRCLWTALWQH